MIHEIAKDIYWTGIKHWTLRHFHGMELSTHRGSTYNSYIIKDEMTVLVDTVWDVFEDKFARDLDSDIGLHNIDAVVINHIEPDHGGAVGKLFEAGLRPEIPIYCSKPGVEIIKKHFQNKEWNLQPVGTGDSVAIGKYELAFVDMRMIHWPDSMMTYVKGANVLLSNDAFGQHYCASGYFNDEVDETILYQEALKYYACILSPFTRLIDRKVDEVRALGLAVDIIAPSHGIIWRNDPMQIVSKYKEWAKDYNDGSVMIIYDSLYGATGAIAEAIGQGLSNKGVRYTIAKASNSDSSDLLTDLFCARGMIIGSSTVNNTTHRSIAGLLDDIKGHKLKGKIGAAFGSYGWSGEAPKMIAAELNHAGIEMFGEQVKINYVPSADELKECVAFGEKFAGAL